ncbi:WhiB family transcriptional regulator [Streptomyces cinereoruber]|uniref:WhiB family transcriptional regulator n=1 Tax=Streptomyces cinereoruber TaxID=67260 RepID=UPI003633780D
MNSKLEEVRIDPITRRRLPRYLLGLPSLANWNQQAACQDADSDLFFPRNRWDAIKAQAICQGCPVVERCLQHSKDMPEAYGVWGGETAGERGWNSAGKKSRIIAEQSEYPA